MNLQIFWVTFFHLILTFSESMQATQGNESVERKRERERDLPMENDYQIQWELSWIYTTNASYLQQWELDCKCLKATSFSSNVAAWQ